MDFLPFKFTLMFIEYFLIGLFMVSPILIFLVGLLLVIAKVTCKIEKWKSYSKSVYFIFITALTIGYGQTVPKTRNGRFLSVLSGFIGVVLSGLAVSVALNSLMISWQATHDASMGSSIESEIQTLENTTFRSTPPTD